eukprot:GILK01000550.1.p1 GENE.GILK01000550.1~~GILK01000550.1.p1  ORF type:complete len:538 (-),score=107.58 GILK01000550.1:84-1637(-)
MAADKTPLLDKNAPVQYPCMVDDPSGIPAAVTSVRKGYTSGKTRDLNWRRSQLKALLQGIKELESEFVEALKTDLGKNPFMSWFSEFASTTGEINCMLSNFASWAKPRSVDTSVLVGPAFSYVVPEPYGVVTVIGPWNFPLYCSFVPMAAAIGAGNACILKPSELAPATSTVCAKLVRQFMDPEAVTVVEGGAEVAKTLLAQRVDYIFFTGSPQKGRLIAEAAAKHLIPTTLELGGKSPTIVDETANLDNAAKRIVFGRLLNAGQVCIAPDYLLVHTRVKSALLEKMKAVVEEFYGANPQNSADYGRIITQFHTKRLADMLKGHGGKVICGGTADVEDRYIAPTIIDEPSKDSTMAVEEIFGPILPVWSFSHLDEAIDFINEREKPLALYLFTSSSANKKAVINRTSSGAMAINETVFQVLNHDLPFGGVGQSGYSAYHGKFSFDTLSHLKAVMDKATINSYPFSARYPPYTPHKQSLMRFLVNTLQFPQRKAVWGIILTILVVALFSNWKNFAKLF